MIKKVLEQIETDLDAYVDHAADCRIRHDWKKGNTANAFQAGAFEAYRQAAVRCAEIVFTYWKPSSWIIKFNQISIFIDSMIEDRMEVKREKLKKV